MPREAVGFTGAPPAVFVSSRGVERLFCGTCGTPLAYRSEKFGDEIHLLTATPENPDSVTPALHEYWSGRLFRTAFDDELPKHTGSSHE
ncbi:GFA family protein [Nisaea sp.]|uniref:GFA family protein n=1 Tax=Nisaea sp. TaxID=2024842 RepID=UPI0032EAC8B9